MAQGLVMASPECLSHVCFRAVSLKRCGYLLARDRPSRLYLDGCLPRQHVLAKAPMRLQYDSIGRNTCLKRGGSQIGAKDVIFFVHSARRPSAELCIFGWIIIEQLKTGHVRWYKIVKVS